MISKNNNFNSQSVTDGSSDLPESYVFWVVALHIEARPIIRWLNLSRRMDENIWPIYTNQRHVLIVSGVGKLRAAMAVTWLTARFCDKPVAGLINVGFCGSNDPCVLPGDIVRVTEVKDMDQDRLYYPDLFSPADTLRMPVQCWSVPVTEAMVASSDIIYCDMESAGVMEAARSLFQTHQVILYKIVSDKLNPEHVRAKMSEDVLSEWIAAHTSVFNHAVEHLDHLLMASSVPLLEEQNHFVSQVEKMIPLTSSMKQQLEDKTRQLILNRQDDIDEVYQYLSLHLAYILQTPLRSKKHVKRAYDAFIKVMDEKIDEKSV